MSQKQQELSQPPQQQEQYFNSSKNSYYGTNTYPVESGIYRSQVNPIGHPEYCDLHPMEPVHPLACTGAPTWHSGSPYWNQYQIPYPHHQYPNQNFPICSQPPSNFKQEIPVSQNSLLNSTGNSISIETNEQVLNTMNCKPETQKNSEDEKCAEVPKEENVRSVRVLMGFVTSLDGDLGCIDTDVFFHASVVKGPVKPKKGDFVLVNAESVEHMPTIKWNAKEVQVLDKSFSTHHMKIQNPTPPSSPVVALSQNVAKSFSPESSDEGLCSKIVKTGLIKSESSSKGHKRKSCDSPDTSDEIQILSSPGSQEIIECVNVTHNLSDNKFQDPKNLAKSIGNEQNVGLSTYSDPNQPINVQIPAIGASKIKTERMDAFQENVLNEVTAKNKIVTPGIPRIILITKIKSEKCDEKSGNKTAVKLVEDMTEELTQKDNSIHNLSFGTKTICENEIEVPKEKDVQNSTPNSSICTNIPLMTVAIKKEKIDKNRAERSVESITSIELPKDPILITKIKSEKYDPPQEMPIESVKNSDPVQLNSSADLEIIEVKDNEQTQSANSAVKFTLANCKNVTPPPCDLQNSHVIKGDEKMSEGQNDTSSELNVMKQSGQSGTNTNSSKPEHNPKSVTQDFEQIDSADELKTETSYSSERYQRRRKSRSSSSGSSVKKFRGPTCSFCGKVGHRESVCYRPKKCFYCGKRDHAESVCWFKLECRRCGKTGHPERKCVYQR